MPDAPPPPRGWPPGWGADPSERDALLVLSGLQSMLPRDFHGLAWEHGSAARVLEAIRRGKAGTPGDRRIAERGDPVGVRRVLGEAGARQVVPGSDDYPDRLLDLPDPPACLFVKGETFAEREVAVAIVGARRSTSYGRGVATSFAAAAAASGATVVSGAALGIDAAAHRGALSVAGRTVAVLGCGIDIAHPRSNRVLIAEIARIGALVSEYPPGVPPEARRFPARNRLVAALSRAVVVVEGGERSGSRLTAGFAADLGRDVLAVPGPVDSPLSEAPHTLLREGAGLAAAPEDLLAALDLAPWQRGPDDHHELPPDEVAVLGVLSGAAATPEAVARSACLSTDRAVVALASLELRGLASAGGGRYARAPEIPRGSSAGLPAASG